MSGIVGSYFNTRGSGVVAKLGTDGQVFTSTGAGLSQGFEAAAGGGKILQVVSYSSDAHSSQTEGTTFVDISSFLVAITPTATDSRIWIDVGIGLFGGDDNRCAIFAIERAISGGTTELLPAGTAASNRLGGHARGFSTSGYHGQSTSFSILDTTHNTTSEITYQLQWCVQQTTTYINRTVVDVDFAHYGSRTISQMTAWEIGA